VESPTGTKHCGQCGREFPPSTLSCPSCQKLVYTEELRKIAGEADLATRENRLSDAMSSWRSALELLPPDSKQYQAIRENIELLSRRVDGLQAPPTAGSRPQTGLNKNAGRAGLLGLLAIFFSKLKFLALGFAKLHTLFSMLLAFGVYWSLWGWPFALGFVLSIYIHEMGHVAMLNHYGIKATAPVFIPGVGAFVRMNQVLASARENARVGLAGPIWGLGAAVAAFAVYRATNAPVMAAIARTGAWINLFNLLPVWQLDGGRGFQSLSNWQRWAAFFVIGLCWAFTREGLLLLLLVAALFQALKKDAPREPDALGLLEYAALVAILSLMCTIPVATP